ncbi:hypothetical protein EMCRGX_G020812 [Ephydatia muelleri]
MLRAISLCFKTCKHTSAVDGVVFSGTFTKLSVRDCCISQHNALSYAVATPTFVIKHEVTTTKALNLPEYDTGKDDVIAATSLCEYDGVSVSTTCISNNATI